MRNIAQRFVLLAAAVGLVGVLTLSPLGEWSTGHAGDATVSGSLAGSNVVMLMAVAPGDKDYVEDLTGQITKVDDVGVLLAVRTRTLIDGDNRSSGDYAHSVFVPWSSVLYLKIVP